MLLKSVQGCKETKYSREQTKPGNREAINYNNIQVSLLFANVGVVSLKLS
jgi:hypothetical protein